MIIAVNLCENMRYDVQLSLLYILLTRLYEDFMANSILYRIPASTTVKNYNFGNFG